MAQNHDQIIGYQVIFRTKSGITRRTHPMTHPKDAESYKSFINEQSNSDGLAYVRPVTNAEKDQHRL